MFGLERLPAHKSGDMGHRVIWHDSIAQVDSLPSCPRRPSGPVPVHLGPTRTDDLGLRTRDEEEAEGKVGGSVWQGDKRAKGGALVQ